MNDVAKWFDELDFTMDHRVPEVIAETSTEYFKERLIQKNWDGKAYPKYNPNDNNKRKEPTAGSLMMRSNNLFSSIRPGIVRPDLVVVSAGGGKVGYAKVHNQGLRVRGVQYVRPHYKKNFMGKEKGAHIKGHSRKIDFKMPKRQFMGRSAANHQQIRTRLKNLLK